MKRILAVIVCLLVFVSSIPLYTSAYFVSDGDDASYVAAAEAMVLLKNDNSALPLTSTDKIAVFGEGQVYTDGKTGGYFLMGRGSGYFVSSKTPRSPCDLLSDYAKAGKIGGVYTKLSDAYKTAANKAAAETDFIYTPTEAECKAAADYADKAIYILNRTSKEGADNTAASFELDAREKSDLTRICAAFSGRPVIVVLNTGSVMSCGFALGRYDGIYADAVITAPYLGICGAEVLCDALVGDINPSGKTVDTYAGKITDYPSYNSFAANNLYSNYTEDIYVGYRYFETFAPEIVDYPFGYGLSYTDFELSVVGYSERGGKISVSVKVTNTGKVSGKEVVQLYFEAPQKGTGTAVLSKASRELCSFEKTKLLSPGESQTLELVFSVDDMASYDDLGATGNKSAYVLEAGRYIIHAGRSVRDTVVAGEHSEPSTRVVKQLSELCEPNVKFERMTYDGKESVGGNAVERTDLLHTPVEVKKTALDSPIQFSEILTGNVTVDEFLSQMSDEELCSFAVMTLASATNTKGWGGSAEMAEKYGIPIADTCDGPAGLRISTKGTGLPCATALACTYNKEAVARLGDVIGRESVLSEVDIWLAPAVNIHRLPLCGRNFEYYSEDPYISGVMASEIIRGVEAYGIACSVKHFVGNEREYYRSTMSSNMSERALREIYLEPFRMAVESGVSTVMTSYNKLNGTETAENAELLRGILRGEWGFEGLITTDWSNDSDLAREVIAGNNVHSSTSEGKLTITPLVSALKQKKVTRSLLCENAKYVIDLLIKLPDGKRLADPVVHKVSPSGASVIEAENYTHKHAYARPEISGNVTVMAYTRSYGTDWVPYLTYTLEVEQDGWYILSCHLANNASTLLSDALSVYVNGKEQPCAFNALNTGGWAKLQELTVTRVYLERGRNTLKVKSAEGRSCGNFDKFTLRPISEVYTPIGSADEMIKLMNTPSMWSGKYYLTSDIDLTGVQGQSPIGTYSKNFTGVFDGMGHSVTGLDMSTDEERDFGLFGKVKYAAISDLKVYGKINSNYAGAVVGGIVGTLDPRSVILGCENHVEVTYTNGSVAAKGVGGIAGYIYSGSDRSGSVIKLCTNYAAIRSESGGNEARVGGIAGVLDNSGVGMSEVVDSLNIGEVYGDGNRVGGIVGYLSQKANGGGCFVLRCENRGDVVSSGGECGGFVGLMSSASTVEEQQALVSDCTTRAQVTGGEGAQNVGSFVGKSSGGRLLSCKQAPAIIDENEETPDTSDTPETDKMHESPDGTDSASAQDTDAGITVKTTDVLIIIICTAVVTAAVAAVVITLKKNGK